MRKLIEYRITYSNGDVDHCNWWEWKNRISDPDVTLIERVIRYWQDDAELVREETKILFEKGER